MVEAATNFRKSGFNNTDSAMLAQVAAQYQNIADTAVSASDAAASITSQIRAFGEDAGFATTVINAYNEVANNFSVGTNDISNAMEIASSGMATYGNSFQQVIGLVTSGTEIMQGRASQVARGLSTIAARIVKNQDALAEYGIQVEKTDGSLKSTFDVLSELKPKWDAMTDAQRVALGDTLAGQNQYKVLASVMSNFQHAIDATNTALESAGSAAKENAAYMESLEAKENALKAEFEDFANRVLSKDIVKGFLEAGTSMLDFANNDVGAAITRIGLLATGMTGLTGIVGQTVGKIVEVGLQLKNLGVGSGSFLGMLASGKVALIVGGVVLAITALVEIIRAVTDAYKEAHPSFEDANKNLQETQTEIQNTTIKLEEYKNKLQELDDIDEKDRGTGWAAERAELEINVQTANAYLEILRQIEQAQLGKVKGSNYITGYTGKVVGDYSDGYIGTEASEQMPITEEQLKAITAEYTNQEEAVMSISLALKDYITGWEDFNDMSQDEIVEELNSQLSALGINVQAITETVGESFESMGSLSEKAAGGFDNLTRAEQDQANQYLADYQTYVHGIVSMGGQLDAEQQKQIQTYYNLAASVSNFDATQATTADTIAFVASTFNISASAAANLAAALGYIDPSLTSVASSMVQLSNGAWALKENCEQAANGIWELKDGASELASAVDSVGATAATAAANLLNEANSVDTTSQSFRDLVAQEIIFNNTSYDVSTKIAALQALAIQAGVTREAIAGISTAGIGGTASNRAELAKEARNQGLRGKEVAEWVTQQLQQESSTSLSEYYAQLSKMMEAAQKNKSSGAGGGGSSGKSAEEKAAEEAEKQAKKAQQAQEKAAKESQRAYESAAKSAEQAAQEAARAAEQAAEEAKQKILDVISELKDASDDFWDSKTDAIEETNTELDRQKQLEEKLKALEEAKQKKILLYKNGQFQYDRDYGSIAKAQADYEETRDKIHREKELEQLKEMKDNATEIFNEMKDIINNGGNVTQDMIDKWLKNMSALGADYYDSNKTILNEWLDWAKDAINDLANSIKNSLSSNGSADGTGIGGAAGSVTSEDVSSSMHELNNTLLEIDEILDVIKRMDKYQDDEEFLKQILDSAGLDESLLDAGMRGNYKMNLLAKKRQLEAPFKYMELTNTSSPYVYAWKNWFNRELQGRLDLGSNTVFAGYQDKLLSGTIDDPYEEQEYLQRLQAIRALRAEYESLIDQLGYIPENIKKFMELTENLMSNVDIIATKMVKNYDELNSSQKTLLNSLIEGEKDYEVANKSRVAYLAENYSSEYIRWMNLVRAAGSSRNARQLWEQRTDEDKARDEALYGDRLDQLRKMVDEAGGIVTDEIYSWFIKNLGQGALDPNATGDSSLYSDIFTGSKYLYKDQEELERLGYHGFLGNYGNVSEGGLSETTENLVKSKILTETTPSSQEEYKNTITQKNIKGIKDTLDAYANGYGATQHWIDDATKYITDQLKKNNEALLTASEEQKKVLEAQNKELINLKDGLEDVDTTVLPGSTTSYNEWEFKIDNPSDEELAAKAEERAKKLAAQMEANSKAWWSATTKEEKDALHKANEELANTINEITGSNLTYEGSTGTWSKNAHGTHNFSGGLSLVGENGPELRVLGKGDNIIPHSQTENLWKWSSTTPQAMLSKLSAKQSNGGTNYMFNVSRIELPNVTDAKSFVNGLKNYALQYSYKR